MIAKLNPMELQEFAVTARLLWLRRNSIIFGGSFSTPVMIIRQAREQVEAYEQAEGSRSLGLIQTATAPATWRRPAEGCFKINWDASLDKMERRMGMGIAVRDHESKLQAAPCATMDFITKPVIVEALFSSKVAALVQTLGLRRIVLEGDALEVISVLKQDDSWIGTYGSILTEEKQMLSTCTEWQVQHVQRHCNGWLTNSQN